MLLLVAVILALPAGWLNTALVLVNAALGVGYFIFEIVRYVKG